MVEEKRLILYVNITTMEWIEKAKQALHDSLHPIPSELNQIDWKSGLSPDTKRLAQHICAFANEQGGGFFAFGVENSGVDFCSFSSEDAEEIAKKMGNIAGNNLCIAVKIEHSIENFEGHPILFFHVPEQAVKPVYLRGQDVYEAYYRTAGQTRKMPKHIVNRLLAQQQGISFEEMTAKGGLSVDEVLSLVDYKCLIKKIDKGEPSSKEAIMGLLQDYKICRKNEDKWEITNLGAILFANNLADFPRFESKYVIARKYQGDSNRFLERDLFFRKGYACELEDMVDQIMKLMPRQEDFSNTARKDTYPYPVVAVRELLANACIHQDLDAEGTNVCVEIFDNRLSISNPGAPLVEVNRMIDTLPVSRNNKLAEVMFYLHLCEKRGSGMDRTVASLEEKHLPPYKVVKGQEFTRVFIYPEKSYKEMTKQEKIQACYQHACLLFEDGKQMTNQSLRERLSIGKNNSAMVSRLIADSVAAGLIKPSSEETESNKFKSYIPYYG